MQKAHTGISGFDEITRGGLPRGRTTLLEAGPGCGKTIMALQTLVNGARINNEPGIFVAFEESSDRIIANAAQFGWDLVELQKKKLFFLDIQPTPELFQAGSFDLGGMLAVVEQKAREIKAKRIVFDAMDIVLALMKDPVAERLEMFRLHEWLIEHGFTAIITSKAGEFWGNNGNQAHLGFMQFMVDCAVVLKHDVVMGVSQRNMRVVKYRGSSFSENEAPFLIGGEGMEVAAQHDISPRNVPFTTQRVSSGVARLDTMLGGGYYRGATVIITGFPGTAKSTLGGAFAEAACKRGERALFVSFDSEADEVARNLDSVNIRLGRFVKKGLLRLVSDRALTGSAEIHLMQIKKLALEHRATCVVVDPISALGKAGNETVAHNVAERLFDWAKAAGITLLCTSLLENSGPQAEGTPLHISTLADTWIHLNYLVHAGERNRGLSIVKSRGTGHSNQVRELLLSERGVTLADAYTAGGEVLMGTLRWEKECAVTLALHESDAMAKRKQAELVNEEAVLEARLKALQAELEAKRAENRALGRRTARRSVELANGKVHLRGLRGVGKE